MNFQGRVSYLAVGSFHLSFSPILPQLVPSCSDIIGHYVIDRSKYPGANANWQYETYSFDITQSHIIVHDNRTTTAWKNQITWSDDQNYRWVFADVFFKQE